MLDLEILTLMGMEHVLVVLIIDDGLILHDDIDILGDSRESV